MLLMQAEQHIGNIAVTGSSALGEINPTAEGRHSDTAQKPRLRPRSARIAGFAKPVVKAVLVGPREVRLA